MRFLASYHRRESSTPPRKLCKPMVWQALQPITWWNALEPFSASGAKSFSLPFPTGLHFNQLPSIRSSTPTFLRYSPYRTTELKSLFLNPSTRASKHSLVRWWTMWKSTYPYPASSCLKLSTVYTRLLNVSLLAWNYQKHITQTDGRLCVSYINFRSSISRVPKAHILPCRSNRAAICSICPILWPFQHHFLCYLPDFHSPLQS